MNTKAKNEFIQWFEEFKEKHGGYFASPSDWYDEVQKKHRNLRKFLGKSAVTIEVDLERNHKEAIDLDLVLPFYVELITLIPNYFRDYAFNNTCFQKMMVPAGPQAGMAWGKHINHWMKRDKISADIQSKVAKSISKLGIVYAQQKTTKDKYYITISTRAADFASIGHLSVDSNSCFKNEALNEAHKFIIGENENTFVGFVSKKPMEDEENSSWYQTPKMRFWGIADKTFKRFDVCNIYPRHPDDQGNVYRSISKAFGQLIDVEKPRETNRSFRVEGVFLNKESPITYSANYDNLDQLVHKFSDKHSKKYRKCIRCGLFMNEYENIDFSQYCLKCAKQEALICPLTKRKTMTDLVPAYKNGKPISVCQTALLDYFKPVKLQHHHIDDLKEVDGKFQLKDSL